MIVTNKHYIIGAIILFLALKVIFNYDADEDAVKIADTHTVEVVNWSLQKDVEFKATQRRIRHLEQLEERQQQYTTAAKELPNNRQRILDLHKAEWTAILETHWAEYELLFEIAQLDDEGMTDCTICSGDTYLDFCIFCAEPSNGICPSCLGEGLQFGKELCPTCRGNGECFMCTSELHLMMCPFCDDGSIDIDQPAPSPFPIAR